jgi:hypothetical protein
VLNNLIAYNGNAGGDPHGVEIVAAAPRVLNNTIVRGDSNGIILRGNSPALIMNNVIAYNGSVQDGDRRGRGICDFSGGAARIHYNLFFRNRIGALLTNGTELRAIRRAERQIGLPRLTGNLDKAPGFVRRVPPPLESPEAAAAVPSAFLLRTMGSIGALHAGNPDPAYADRDGMRNTLGFTGGPHAAP